MKPSTPSRSSPSASASQRASSSGSLCGSPRCAGVICTSAAHPLRDARARTPASSRRPSRRPTSTALSRPALVEHGLEVGDQVGVLVGRAGPAPGSTRRARARRRRRPEAGALQQPRPVHDVAARRRQPVREHDRRALAGPLAGQLDAARARPSRSRPAPPQPSSVDQISSFVRTRAITSSVNSDVVACPPRSGVRMPAADRLQHRLVDRARRRRGRGRAAPSPT